uniref:NAD(P)/FAD-dependent oxidoreductase n=1 Tax=Thermofilum pendens TaxID=2269 RepID=A0A7J3X5C9_THEPE
MRSRVVVVGLGPAGAAALRRLNELGVPSVGVERKVNPESPPVCGEFLPEPDAVKFISSKPSVSKAFSYISLVKRRNSVSAVRLEFEGGKGFTLRVPGFTISRAELVNKLIESSEYYLGEDVVGLRRVGSEYVVKTRRGREITAKYVIACDGYPSAIRSLLGETALLPPGDVAPAVNAKVETPHMKKDLVYMYASPETAGGYAWVIPFEGDVSNVGVGLRLSYVKKGLSPVKALERFIERNPHGYLTGFKIIEPPKGRWVPVAGFYAEPEKDGVMFAGDSLGAVNPINGGGIFPAMALGILAAEAAWLDSPHAYPVRAWSEVGSILEVGRVYRKLVDFLYSNWRFAVKLSYFFSESMLTKVIKGEKTALLHLLRLLERGTRNGYRRRTGLISRRPR